MMMITQVCQIAARFQDEGDERQVLPFLLIRWTIFVHKYFFLIISIALRFVLPVCTNNFLVFDNFLCIFVLEMTTVCTKSQMTDELRQAFRLYDKEQHGYISTLVLKVILSSSHINNTAIFSITIIIVIAIIIIIIIIIVTITIIIITTRRSSPRLSQICQLWNLT